MKSKLDVIKKIKLLSEATQIYELNTELREMIVNYIDALKWVLDDNKPETKEN